MMKQEEWINQLRQKMADYEEPAPEMLWEDIEKALADQKPKAKTVPMWFRKVAVAAVLLVIAGVGYMTLEHDAPELASNKRQVASEKRQVASEKRQVASEKRQVASEKLQVTSDYTLTAHLPLISSHSSLLKPAGQVSGVAIETEVKSEATKEPVSEKGTEAELATLPSEPEEKPQDNHTEQRHTNVFYAQSPVSPSNPYRSTASENRLTAKLYFSNTMGNSDLLAMSNPIVISGSNNPGSIDNPLDPDDFTIGDPDDNPDTQPGYNANTQTTTSKTHHHQPVRYGLSLRYRLSERWGIETGLAYTKLTSDIETTEKGLTTKLEQRLTYLGIPLKTEYTIWGNRHFNIYASAGAMVEKMVKGSLITTGKGTKESLSIRPLQFSVSSGIGAEYRYNNLLSIYVEPGVGYYFDNGSSVPTFYQDKPLNFNLNIGLRFTLNCK